MVESLTDREREKIARVYLINNSIQGLSHTQNLKWVASRFLYDRKTVRKYVGVWNTSKQFRTRRELCGVETRGRPAGCSDFQWLHSMDEALVAVAGSWGCGGCGVQGVVELASFCHKGLVKLCLLQTCGVTDSGRLTFVKVSMVDMISKFVIISQRTRTQKLSSAFSL